MYETMTAINTISVFGSDRFSTLFSANLWVQMFSLYKDIITLVVSIVLKSATSYSCIRPLHFV